MCPPWQFLAFTPDGMVMIVLLLVVAGNSNPLFIINISFALAKYIRSYKYKFYNDDY